MAHLLFLALMLVGGGVLKAEFQIKDISNGNHPHKNNMIFTKKAGQRLSIGAFSSANSPQFMYRCTLGGEKDSNHQETMKRLLSGDAADDAGRVMTGGILGASNGIEAGDNMLTCYVHYYDGEPHSCIKSNTCYANNNTITYVAPNEWHKYKDSIPKKRPEKPWEMSHWDVYCINDDTKEVSGVQGMNMVAPHLQQYIKCAPKEVLIVVYKYPFYAAPYYEATLSATTKLQSGATAFKNLDNSGNLTDWKSGQNVKIKQRTSIGECFDKPCNDNYKVHRGEFDPINNNTQTFHELVIRTNEEVQFSINAKAVKLFDGSILNTKLNSKMDQINFLAIDGKRIESASNNNGQRPTEQQNNSKKNNVNQVMNYFNRKSTTNMLSLAGDESNKNKCMKGGIYPTANKAGPIQFGEVKYGQQGTDPLTYLVPMDVILNNGQGSQNFKVSFGDVAKGTLVFKYIDLTIAKKVRADQDAGRCGFNGAPCPYPPLFEFNIPFTVVPDYFDFKISGKEGETKPKYAYLGRSEEGKNSNGINIIARRDYQDKAITSHNFTNDCASRDMMLSLQNTSKDNKYLGINSGGIVLTIDDREDGLIPSSKFLKGELDQNNVVTLAKKDGNKASAFSPSDVENPIYIRSLLLKFANVKSPSQWPTYVAELNMLAIRPRLNLIDSDNSKDINQIPSTKAYYEFYCGVKPRVTSNACDDEMMKLLKEKLGDNITKSPTATNWLVNPNGRNYPVLTSAHISIDGGDIKGKIKVKEIKRTGSNYDEITFEQIPAKGRATASITDVLGRHKVRVRTGAAAGNAGGGGGIGGVVGGVVPDGNVAARAPFSPYPLYMLYNPYYERGSWGVNSFFDIYPKAAGAAKSQGVSTMNPVTKGKSRIFSGN